MTVEELIEQLQRLPGSAQTAQVWFLIPWSSGGSDPDDDEREMVGVDSVTYEGGKAVLE